MERRTAGRLIAIVAIEVPLLPSWFCGGRGGSGRTVPRNRIRGRRFELQQASAREFNQVYLWTGRTNAAGRKIYVVVDAYDESLGIFSLKSYQLASTPEKQILDALDEAFEKYRSGNFTIAEVPSRPVQLPVNEPLTGRLHVEFAVQRAEWVGSVKDSACTKANALEILLVDANGSTLCP